MSRRLVWLAASVAGLLRADPPTFVSLGGT